ncbi:unnamed protein product [Somion occarium]|uniref:Uncharacterized protein n=1 Tax=Somion occarium TaxID=3059160 RepID=A0ABP1DGF8_9APHY
MVQPPSCPLCLLIVIPYPLYTFDFLTFCRLFPYIVAISLTGIDLCIFVIIVKWDFGVHSDRVEAMAQQVQTTLTQV